jgi:rubrerythrin
MIAQKTTTTRSVARSNDAAVQEAIALLTRTRVQVRRWVCEVCGMVHTGSAPDACDSCGASALVQQPDLHREMSSHW